MNEQPPGAPPPTTSAWDAYSTRIIGILSLGALGVGTVVYHILEDWGWVDSFYFSAVALTTVGFGDLSPSTDASKLFTVFYIFSGISLIGALLNELSKRHAKRMATRSRHASLTLHHRATISGLAAAAISDED